MAKDTKNRGLSNFSRNWRKGFDEIYSQYMYILYWIIQLSPRPITPVLVNVDLGKAKYTKICLQKMPIFGVISQKNDVRGGGE